MEAERISFLEQDTGFALINHPKKIKVQVFQGIAPPEG
jgi:hypothetical protein